MASEGLHEARELLDEATIDHHRVLISLREELEAIDWYDQRIAATADDSLAALLTHNRDEEKEHAAMALEWLRRRDAALDHWLRTYLFTSDPVTDLAEAVEMAGAEAAGAPAAADAGERARSSTSSGTIRAELSSLGIGSLKGSD